MPLDGATLPGMGNLTPNKRTAYLLSASTEAASVTTVRSTIDQATSASTCFGVNVPKGPQLRSDPFCGEFEY